MERMLLGNKCDMDDKRVVPKAKGEQVSTTSAIFCIGSADNRGK